MHHRTVLAQAFVMSPYAPRYLTRKEFGKPTPI